MVVSSVDGASIPVYGGTFAVGGYDEGYFSSTWVAA
jgi:hypothetical protein